MRILARDNRISKEWNESRVWWQYWPSADFCWILILTTDPDHPWLGTRAQLTTWHQENDKSYNHWEGHGSGSYRGISEHVSARWRCADNRDMLSLRGLYCLLPRDCREHLYQCLTTEATRPSSDEGPYHVNRVLGTLLKGMYKDLKR